MANIKKDVYKASALPRNYIEEALALNVDEAILIPVEDRRKVLAGLHYYTTRTGSHDGFKFKTKAAADKKGMVYLLRVPIVKKKKATTKTVATNRRQR